MSSKSEMDKYERLRQKHGASLLKVIANKEKIKQQGTVKSWMEVFVLLNDKNPSQVRPVQAPRIDPSKRVDPRIAAGLIPPPSKTLLQPPAAEPRQASPRQVPQQAPVEVAAPKRGMTAYEQLPTPQNPKLVLANDRKVYDNALEQQLVIEQQKLEALFRTPNATAGQIQQQRDKVEQLIQQKELVLRQKKQAEEERQRQIREAQERAAAKAQPVPQLPPPEQLKGSQLEETLKAFFKVHEPEALEDGRLEAVLMWTEERGVEKLCAMLREQYGRDLYGKTNAENTAVDQVQADRYARRLMGFYKAHGVHDMQWHDCLKLGEWACKAGEAALNARLHAKYNDDLDSFGQTVMLSVEGRLRKFYERRNPEVLEKGLGPLLTWVVSNGVEALNEMLLEKYGEDLDGRKAPPKHPDTRDKSARAVFHRELTRDDAIAKVPSEDHVAKRKEMLIKQLASFLEVKDPNRLRSGGLAPLVQWALPRTDKQVDELLMESYGADLEDEGLRRFSFDDAEVRTFATASEGIAGGAGRVASSQIEDEFARTEIRSVRAVTDERPISRLDEEDDFPEPDF